METRQTKGTVGTDIGIVASQLGRQLEVGHLDEATDRLLFRGEETPRSVASRMRTRRSGPYCNH